MALAAVERKAYQGGEQEVRQFKAEEFLGVADPFVESSAKWRVVLIHQTMLESPSIEAVVSSADSDGSVPG